ncbi:N-acetylneuraminate lyase [Hydrogenispora ethanolica]|uniref:N-acetylneuraminate lyase n=1 Tax=Hydrogenispora ethanolica TaxID=1082276 RepID=A0A4R1S563_HYDET|nr:N-acetylneuraminate lyase [Hydrogenispora ethanolica]TCL74154.1 N-acetylneuraminate lyase [Hydrogenispora ethanolica]
MAKLQGIYPALITPFTKEGGINHQALREIVRLNLEKGVDGFYVGGSTAEAFMLSQEERKAILETVADEAGGKAAIIYHIGCIHTEHAAELGKFAAKVGVDALSSVPPFYYKFSFQEIKDYYFDLIEQTGLPMIVYNIPAFSGVNFSIANVKELTANPRVIGIKHTSYDLFQLEQMKTIDSRLTIFNGHDEVFLAGLAMGADGAIGSTYNFMAEKFVAINRLYAAGRIQEAQQLQVEANQVIDLLIEVGVFQGIKYVLNLMGIDSGECRKPFRSLNDEQKQRLAKLTEEHRYFQAKQAIHP